MSGPRRITIGRAPGSDLQFRSKVVSLHHATLERNANAWIISDCESRNGTWVNGRRIRRHILSVGDRVSLGSLDISDHIAKQFEIEYQPRPAPELSSESRRGRRASLAAVIITTACVILAVPLGVLWLSNGRGDSVVAKPELAVGGLTVVVGVTDTVPPQKHRVTDLYCEVCFDCYGSRIVEGSTLASSSSVSDTTGVCPRCTKAKDAGKLLKDLERVGGL